MRIKNAVCANVLSTRFAALLLAAAVTPLTMLPAMAQTVTVKPNEIGGTVTGIKGPEAGVWVIAETRDLPTKYVRIVVTDDAGRYLIPDLPKANYTIWVRGYGLTDSPKVTSGLGKTLDLKSVQAPSRAAAAQYYPGGYWYALLKMPDAKLFPGTGPSGNGMTTLMKDQGMWLRFVKTDGCIHCHQLGDLATRTLPDALGHFKTGAEAWERRLQSGQASSEMVAAIGSIDASRALSLFGDWTDRVAEGELPQSDPSRPTGRERDVVVTEWDWATPTSYMHDAISTDHRNPMLNPNGRIYGAPEMSSDNVPWLDPATNTTGFIRAEWRDPKTPTTKNQPIYAPSPYWGNEPIWDSHTFIHNPMLDEKNRLWLTARIRPLADPAYCKDGSIPSSKVFPMTKSGRQIEVYDPGTKKVQMIDTCFQTHHLQFDKKGTLWFSAGMPYDVIGWLDVTKWDVTHDEKTAQGWSPFVLDTNGNGKRDDGWVEPSAPVEPQKDKRIVGGLYGVGPNLVDGTIWGSVTGFPGGVMRFDPKTQLSEFYEVPYKNSKTSYSGFSPRGSDMASDGVIWVSLASGHLASFDRRLCKGKLNGPIAADGQNVCPEGWQLYQLPGPSFKYVAKGTPGAESVEAPYYVWVDQFNVLGLGKDTPIVTGNESDSLMALKDGKFIVMHIPYPMSFYAKNLDGRIDNASAGWKGRGLWTLYSDRSAPHIEGGKGQQSKAVHVQLRNSPLAD